MLDKQIPPGHFPSADLLVPAPAETSKEPSLGEIWILLAFMNFCFVIIFFFLRQNKTLKNFKLNL